MILDEQSDQTRDDYLGDDDGDDCQSPRNESTFFGFGESDQ